MDTLGATIGSLFNVVRLFVLFDLISSGSRKNDNLWKSLGGIMVNGAPREVPFTIIPPRLFHRLSQELELSYEAMTCRQAGSSPVLGQ